ncbi:rhomboid family intramembrane serine protease [Microbulbifer taiwanensis]|uniref:rhomboid family intramembrane serine protease n=1 Tax=Microbulbifer taiwanensis TaxID=986746 RepID=UPI0036106E5C
MDAGDSAFFLPHALFNALGIWILGRPLEARAGTLAFAALVLFSAAASNLAQYYWSPQMVFGGMSGVVYALVGGVFVLQRWQPGWRDVPAGIVALAVGWLLLCATGLVTYVLGVGVANAAHFGGFISGLLLTLLYCLAGGARHFSDNTAGNSAAA